MNNLYPNAITELRQLIADTQYNKRTTKKALIGDVNGTNDLFYTYDKRIIAGQGAIAQTLVVYVDDVENDNWSLNDPIGGEIQMTTPPTTGQKLTATYYWNWWTDAELINFLNKAAESIGITDPNAINSTPTKNADQAYQAIPGGLKRAALLMATSLAFNGIAAYMFARRHSSEFLMEQDGNDDEGYSKLIDSCNKMSAQYEKSAYTARDDFYKAQGRQLFPTFQTKIVGTKSYGPRR